MKKSPTAKRKVITISGKRKTAIARATFRPGKGRVRVNRIPIEIFSPEISRMKMMEPLLLTDGSWSDADIDVDVSGGGFMGQAEATRTALARGIVEWTKIAEVKRRLTEQDRTMLAGDPRRTEPKKFGGPGARRRKQKSYR